MKSVSLIKKSFVGTESSYPELRSKSDMNNYRPIYVISTIAKVLWRRLSMTNFIYICKKKTYYLTLNMALDLDTPLRNHR